jgi:hypothetical protein
VTLGLQTAQRVTKVFGATKGRAFFTMRKKQLPYKKHSGIARQINILIVY